MTEALWYSYVARNGARPLMRRLCRVERQLQYDAVIEFAIAWASGRASWKWGTNTITMEEIWYWPTSSLLRPGDTGWWYLSRWFVRRARSLHQLATWTSACDRGDSDSVVRYLQRWKRSGRWRQKQLRPTRT